MRIIARRERPHPGAQLRITDADGWRITVFATNVVGGRLAELEVQHRLRARAEDRIRCLKDTGLRNLPLHDFTANQIWLEIVQLAADLLTWTQHLALDGSPARAWEPKRLRLRLLNIAGRIVRSGRREFLRLPRGWPWTSILLAGHHRRSEPELPQRHDDQDQETAADAAVTHALLTTAHDRAKRAWHDQDHERSRLRAPTAAAPKPVDRLAGRSVGGRRPS